MANSFKRYTSESVTTEAVVHTAPVATQTTVIGMTIANTSANAMYVSVKLGTTYLVKEAPVSAGGALVAVGGDQKVVMEAGDTISVESTETADVIISVLEIS